MRSPFNQFNQKGFSLPELLVSILLITVIITAVALNQSTYTDQLALTNLADQISLDVFQAQAYGIGVKGLPSNTNNFNIAYGVHFRSTQGGGSNDAYIFWADKNANDTYDSGWNCPTTGSSECLAKISISRGNLLEVICLIRPNGTEACNNIGGVHVSFSRPDPSAKIIFFNNGGNKMDPQPANIGVKIKLISPKGSRKAVTVFTTGQVSVQ